MKREDFLKILGTTGTSFLLGSAATAADRIAFQLTQVVIYDNYIRGTSFYKDGLKGKECSVGEEVTLHREEENQYDSFAVGVLVRGTRLGYIASYENIILANLLDAGVRVVAHLSEVNDIGENEYIKDVYAVQVRAELMVPINGIKKVDKGRADNAVDVYRTGIV